MLSNHLDTGEQEPLQALSFKQVRRVLRGQVSERALAAWESAALRINRSPSELTQGYLKCSIEVHPLLADRQFADWCKLAADIASSLPEASKEMLSATPGVLKLISPRFLEDWVLACSESGDVDKAEAIELSCLRFASSPQLLEKIGLQSLLSFYGWITRYSERSPGNAAICFNLISETLDSVRGTAKRLFNLLDTYPATEFRALREFIEMASSRFRRLPAGTHEQVFQLLERFKAMEGVAPVQGLRALSELRNLTDELEAGKLIQMTFELANISVGAAKLFLEGLPHVLQVGGYHRAVAWYGDALKHRKREIMLNSLDLSSDAARRYIERLCQGVLYDHVERPIGIYGHLLAKAPVSVARKSATSRENVLERHGNEIYLPDAIMQAEKYTSNFAICRVQASQQAGYVAYDSYALDAFKPSGKLRDLRIGVRDAMGRVADAAGATGAERFMSIFADTRLANDLFNLVENFRVTHLLLAEYPGLRRDYMQVNQLQLKKRSSSLKLAPAESVLEQMVRSALRDESPLRVLGEFEECLKDGLAMLNCVRAADSSVELSAEVTIRIYLLLRKLPAEPLQGAAWSEVAGYQAIEFRENEREYSERLSELTEQLPKQLNDGQMEQSRPEIGKPQYGILPQVDYWDELDVEGAQRGIADTNARSSEEGLTPKADFAGQLGHSREGNGPADGEVAETAAEDEGIGDGIIEQAGGDVHQKDATEQGGAQTENAEKYRRLGELYLYDEWNYYSGSYRPKWCSLYEKQVEPGDNRLYRSTMQEYGHLANRLKMQFEAIAPELHRKQQKLLEGDDIDLEEAIVAMVDLRAGITPDSRLYWKRNKQDRSTAVAFLLDISASTAETILPTGSNSMYHAGVSNRLFQPTKRILDLERESIILLARSLEHLGDMYGIYAFSGYGRERVEFYIIKELEESMGITEVAQGMGVLAPLHATRMGPAIRHTTEKLARCDRASKFLFLISDGRPQDKGYSRDGTEREYAVRDTRMALRETQKRGVVPFCLTVDQAGNDYMRGMMGDFSYEVLDDVSKLPERLPELYRMVTKSV